MQIIDMNMVGVAIGLCLILVIWYTFARRKETKKEDDEDTKLEMYKIKAIITNSKKPAEKKEEQTIIPNYDIPNISIKDAATLAEEIAYQENKGDVKDGKV